MQKILFACTHNAGRSQMAAAFFNELANPKKAHAVSAGTNPGEHIHPEVETVMREAGIDLSGFVPQKLTPLVAEGAILLITMGCAETCPVVPGAEVQDWALDDPKGKPIAEVRTIRDDIRARVEKLVKERGWI